ncbi:MAG: LemA family protein [candidate division Zixibacteria bacterium RBG_16_53_22]|nr:MAG: LemA family protein [candidate division Zixibacteria bacterium RBG_16_53_22]
MALSRGAIIGLGLVIVVVFLLIVVGIGIIAPYNRLTRLDVGVDKSWAEVNNQLQRRNDMIPNLVETVKGYAAHERELFEHIADARAKLAGATSIPDKINASNEMSGLLSRLLVIVENYPQLKANENFMRLQDELAGTENRLAVARNRYNEAVGIYNTQIRVFPTNLFAGIFGFGQRGFFEVPEAAKQVPVVKF